MAQSVATGFMSTADEHTSSQPSVPLAWTPLSGRATALVACLVVAGYILTFTYAATAPAILVALPALCVLARQRSAWQAFGVGLLVGTLINVVLLAFILQVVGWIAVPLWVVGALPIAVFVLLRHVAERALRPTWAIVWTPVLWTGIEYFRSEIWSLRFAWLLPGQAAAFLPGVRLNALGVYAVGFIYMSLAALAVAPIKKLRVVGVAGLLVSAILMYWPPLPPTPSTATIQVAGLQVERWDKTEVAAALDQLALAHPEAQLLVLNECAFSESVPEEVRDVIRKHQRYLIAGGSVPIEGDQFYNTAFVIGPDGTDVFSQAKSMPVQFLNDGVPAPERRVWDSPWGKIGIAICYDASYSRVMDDFVSQGACGLILPTMDVTSWGEFERRMLHGRVQPVRSAEYGIPTFGVWSSGVSQLTDRHGRVIATAGYPGQGDTITGPFDLSHPGHIPPDRLPAQLAMFATAVFAAYSLLSQLWRAWSKS